MQFLNFVSHFSKLSKLNSRKFYVVTEQYLDFLAVNEEGQMLSYFALTLLPDIWNGMTDTKLWFFFEEMVRFCKERITLKSSKCSFWANFMSHANYEKNLNSLLLHRELTFLMAKARKVSLFHFCKKSSLLISEKLLFSQLSGTYPHLNNVIYDRLMVARPTKYPLPQKIF